MPAARPLQPQPGAVSTAVVVYDLEYFRRWETWTDSYKQNNAALKWLRQEQEQRDSDLRLSNTEFTAVAAIVKGKGMDYDFDLTKVQYWSWLEMVAQLDDESMAYVVNGPDNRSRGLVACWVSSRPHSYDHKRHHQLKEARNPKKDAQLRVWDFFITRDDGSSIRLHPQWSTTKVETFAGGGHDEEVEPPVHGLGESDGRGTYKWFKSLGTQKQLKFNALKRPR